ncbi:hypothetical protein EVAR_14161_1 [Eumeta japonica]|uniref:Uncharacterized protein n=1 Tax=Eumeta variegata TaxID=151549 RepID=A0A4C1UEM4_EUMVA|nr:hypothetical protein EVAR_14161_1 [Eumeta japonica]
MRPLIARVCARDRRQEAADCNVELGANAQSHYTVAYYCAEVKRVKTYTKDDPGPDRRRMTVAEKMVRKVYKTVLADRRVTVRFIAKEEKI